MDNAAFDTETMDKLYLEWSQFTKARTWRELALTEALVQARRRIDYLGVACNDSRHFDANASTFLPEIDKVLSAVGNAPERDK